MSDQNAGDQDGSAVAPRRRVQLDDLPNEIKDNIVQHCHDADLTLDQVFQNWSARGGFPAGSSVNLTALRKGYRSTTAVLSEISKEWHAVCVPYRFQRLRAATVCDDLFQLVIAPLYGHHFTQVVLGTLAPNQVVEFVKALPLLPNLRRFTLTPTLYRDLLALTPELRQAVEQKIISSITKNAKRLSFDGFPLQDTVRYTSGATKLTSLTLENCDSVTLDKLWEIVSPLSHLNRLRVLFVAPQFGPLPQFATLLDKRPSIVPKLTTLFLYFVSDTHRLDDFVGIFASALRTLVIGTIDNGIHLGERLSVLPFRVFPELRYMGLDLPDGLLQATLDAMADPACLPSLRRLDVWTDEACLSDASMASLGRFLAAHTAIEHVSLFPLDGRISLLDESRLAEQLPPGAVVGDSPFGYPVVAMTDTADLAERMQDDGAKEQRENVASCIDDLLRYVFEWRKRVEATGDHFEAARLAELLAPLDVERMLHRL
ncbi:hypothetical protein JCM10908_000498 [Rhodotorula pacifica]|uniref:uncharacterized protein n=1 Tax=Rhodotorula pacifica TaxID=1495444 RepID=UPI00317A8E6A